MHVNQRLAIDFLKDHHGIAFDFQTLKRRLRLKDSDWLQLLPLVEKGLISREKRKDGGRNRYFYWS